MGQRGHSIKPDVRGPIERSWTVLTVQYLVQKGVPRTPTSNRTRSGRVYEARTRDLYFLLQYVIRWYKTRLSFSGCIGWRSTSFQRLRSEILHRSIKNQHFLLKTKKVGATWNRHSKIFIEDCMKMKKIEIKIFRKFLISKFFKNFH